MDVNQIKAKFPGYAGWNDPAAILANFRDTGGAGKGPSGSSPSFTSASSAPGSDINAVLAQQRAEGEALRKKQSAEEEALFKTFETKAAAQPKLTDIYSNLLAEQGVPGLQKTVSTVQGEIFNVKDLIDKLEADVTARTAGTLTTDAQRRRQIAAEREPLSANLGRLATGLTPTVEALKTAREDVGTRLALKSGEQTKELEADRMRIAAASDRFARETTGYTQDRQDTLTVLLDKIKRDQALSDREWQATLDLAKSEREWEQTKKKMEIESANAIKLKQTLEAKRVEPKVVNPYLIPGGVTTFGTGKTQADWDNLGVETFGDVMKSFS